MNLPVPQQHGNSKLPSEWKNTTDSKTWVHKVFLTCLFPLQYRFNWTVICLAQISVEHDRSHRKWPVGCLVEWTRWDWWRDLSDHFTDGVHPSQPFFGKLEKHNRFKDSGAQQAWHQVFVPSVQEHLHCVQCHSRHAQEWSGRARHPGPFGARATSTSNHAASYEQSEDHLQLNASLP